MNEESIFAAALEKRSPRERDAYLDEACRGNAELRAQVEELLSASNAAGSFFEHPPAGLDVTVDAAAHDTHKPAGWDGSLAFLKPTDKPGRIGKLVGNAGEYEIIEVVGSGGMGIVLRAFDTKLSRVVAVKVLAPELARNPTAVKRFLREAKAAAAVVHDHVVTIHNVEESHQPPFLVMQFIDGQTLQQKIDRQGALELKEILRIGCQTAAGLAAAHKHGLVHRDVKPANILLENGVERVKITDFGLARAADDVEITQTGLIAGTPQYMSPEQARGESMDARSDLFSLGSVLYTMCTGRPAFRADTTMGVLRRVCDDEPRPIHEVNTETPPWLEAIVKKLLAKNPDERFQTAAEVSELLAQCLAHVQNPASVPLPADDPAPAAFATKAAAPAPLPAKRMAGVVVLIAVLLGFALLIGVLAAAGVASALAWYLQRGYSIPGPVTPVPEVAEGPTASTAQEGMPLGEWTPLFNGRDLDGWLEPTEAMGGWQVVDGVLTGRGVYSYLVSKRTNYRDFHLRAEVRINEGGNSGLYFRSELPADWKTAGCVGYEAEITSTDEGGKTGSLRRYPQSPVLQQVDAALVPAGEWFTYEVHAVGNQLATYVNGKLAASATDDSHVQGRIALQLIREETTVVEFRKIEIKERLPEPTWDSLFNGQDLAGWNTYPDQSGAWTVKDGALTGGGEKQYLISERGDYQDFQLRAEVKINKVGDGGVLVRIAPRARSLDAETGYEVQLAGDPAHASPTGTIFRRGTAAPGRSDLIKADQWFLLEIATIREQVTVKINGQHVTTYRDPQPMLRGHIVLQSFTEPTKVSFRKIEIQEVPAATNRFVPLFNRQDLAGWKTHPSQPGDWKVESGMLVGSGRVSHLFTERGDYENFHLRFEAKLNAGGDSGVLVRAPFAIEAGGQGPLGYEAQIASKTGTLLEGKNVYGDPPGIPPGTWFNGEVIAAGKQIIVRINGQTTANFEDAERRYTKGHIALQVFSPQTVVQFRKIEIKELPATSAAAAAQGRPAVTSRSSLVFNGPGASGGDVSVFAIAYSPDGELAATGHYGGSVTVWRLCTGEQVATLAGHERTVSSISFASKGKLLATGGEDGVIGLWSTESWEKAAMLTGHTGRIHTLAFCQDDAKLVSVSLDFTLAGDNSIRLWDIAARSESSRLNEKADHNSHAAVSYDGTLVAVASAMGRVRLWDLSKQSPAHDFAGFPTSPCSVAFSRDGSRVAAGYLAREASGDWNDLENAVVRLWDVPSGALLKEYHGHAGPVIGLEFSPDDRRLLSLASDRFDSQGKLVKSSDRSIRIWNVETGREEARIEPSSRVNVARWTPQGDEICTGVRLWNVSAPPPDSVPKEQAAAVWGPVRDGVQIGAAFEEGQQRYAAGEPVKFELKIRNMTDADKTIEIRRPQDWSVGYAGGDELSVRPVGEKEKLTLAPREERVIEPVPPEERGDPAILFPEKSFAAAANVQIKTDGLAKGFYRVEFLAWMGGETQKLSDLGFGFHFDDAGKPPAWTTGRKAAEGPPNNPELKGVVWGEPVLGLSLGIGPALDASEVADGGMTIYLWNTTSEAIDVQHLEYRAQDWQLVVHDAQGNERRTIPIVGGPKSLTRAHLEPGQVVTPGSTTLKRLWNAGVNPPAKLSPGTYKVTTNFDCRRLDYSHFSLRIMSGEAAVEIK